MDRRKVLNWMMSSNIYQRNYISLWNKSTLSTNPILNVKVINKMWRGLQKECEGLSITFAILLENSF